MIAYPAVVAARTSVYLFDNGNDYGRAGFGYADLVAAVARPGGGA